MDTSRQSIIDHLEELRFRLLWSLLAVLVMLVPSCFLAPGAIDLLIRFTCPEGTKLSYIRPMELFFNQLEVALLLSVMLALPIISYQLWQFVAPGLYRHERRIIVRLSGVSTVLFVLGVGFAICFVFPAIMRFSLGMGTEQIKPEIVIDSFVSLVLSLSLGFGAMFQLPVVVCVLVALGVVKLDTMRRVRPFVVTIIFILAAILTPPDVVSQLSLGLPTWLLFEASLLCCRRLDQRRQERERQREEEERTEREREEAEERERRQRQQMQPEPDETEVSYPPPPEVDDSLYGDPSYGYDGAGYAASGVSVTRVRNLTPGRHFSRRQRTRQR